MELGKWRAVQWQLPGDLSEETTSELKPEGQEWGSHINWWDCRNRGENKSEVVSTMNHPGLVSNDGELFPL